MKFEDLDILTSLPDDSYILCNCLVRDEDDNIISLDKKLINSRMLGDKESINTLVEQNTQLTKVITSLLTKITSIENELKSLKERTNSNGDLNSLTNILNELERKVNENSIEL